MSNDRPTRDKLAKLIHDYRLVGRKLQQVALHHKTLDKLVNETAVGEMEKATWQPYIGKIWGVELYIDPEVKEDSFLVKQFIYKKEIEELNKMNAVHVCNFLGFPVWVDPRLREGEVRITTNSIRYVIEGLFK